MFRRVVRPAVWKTIILGRPSSIEAYREALIAKQNRIGYWGAVDLLDKTQIGKKETKVKLARVTVGSLGFERPATLKEIVSSAKKLGLSLCPAEVGLGLRLAYEDQPDGESLITAMKALFGYHNMSSIYRVRNVDNERWLDDDCAEYCTTWPPDQFFVFKLRE